jgi:hypothetical protein
MIHGQNCWRDALAEVASCAPGTVVHGKLASDAKTCTYASGELVTFDNFADTSIGAAFAFTLTNPDGSVCVEFSTQSQPEAVTTLRTSLGTASWTYGDTVSLACPDGNVYEADQLTALNCHGLGDTFAFARVVGLGTFLFEFVSNPHVDVINCTP